MQVRDLLAVTKPQQTALLVFTAIGAYLAAGGPLDLKPLLSLATIGWMSISGTTAVNMFMDSDIDSIMSRTKNRPVPSKRLSPTTVLAFGLCLFIASIVLAFIVSPVLLLAVLLGYFFDILVYTNLLKRTTPANIVVGGLAGAMPAAGGWAYARGVFDVGSVLIGGLVLAWIPMHIWFIAIYYYDDYRLAGIPMLPAVKGIKRTMDFILLSLLAYLCILWAIYATQGYGLLAAAMVSIASIKLLFKLTRLKSSPATREEARKMFKLASPLLALTFVLLSVESILLN